MFKELTEVTSDQDRTVTCEKVDLYFSFLSDQISLKNHREILNATLVKYNEIVDLQKIKDIFNQCRKDEHRSIIKASSIVNSAIRNYLLSFNHPTLNMNLSLESLDNIQNTLKVHLPVLEHLTVPTLENFTQFKNIVHFLIDTLKDKDSPVLAKDALIFEQAETHYRTFNELLSLDINTVESLSSYRFYTDQVNVILEQLSFSGIVKRYDYSGKALFLETDENRSDLAISVETYKDRCQKLLSYSSLEDDYRRVDQALTEKLSDMYRNQFRIRNHKDRDDVIYCDQFFSLKKILLDEFIDAFNACIISPCSAVSKYL